MYKNTFNTFALLYKKHSTYCTTKLYQGLIAKFSLSVFQNSYGCFVPPKTDKDVVPTAQSPT